uniref:Tetratricopeptide repeat protein n=1 Tax=candidate division WOR-3 bacterium TaxID=2052148 RepID=A0A7C6ECV8_UNCW3
MIILVLILIALIFLALYPVLRDAYRRKVTTLPAYTEGLVFLLEGKKEQALVKFKQAVAVDSNNIDAYLRLAKLFWEKGETERALSILEALTLRRTLDKNQEKKIFQTLGQFYLLTERFAKALPIFEELIQLDETDLTNTEILFSLRMKTERYDQAESLLKRLAKLQKDKKRLSYYYAELGRQVSQKDKTKAFDYYKQALKVYPSSVPALLYQGDYYYQEGELNRAIENWRQILVNEPKSHPLVRSRIETAYYDLGKYEEVIEVYQELLGKIPDDVTLYVALAQIYEKKEEPKQAIAVLARAPAKGDGAFFAQLMLCALHLKEGAIKKAEWVLNQLTERFKTNKDKFACENCGLVIQQFAWQCPRCLVWESIKTVDRDREP